MRLAGCVIKNKSGKILLLHRNTAKRIQWEIPGGKIESNEYPESAAMREIKEELGVQVKIEKLLGEKEFIQDSEILHYTWYQAKIISGQPKVKEPNIFNDMRYFSIQEMRKTKLSVGVKSFLNYIE